MRLESHDLQDATFVVIVHLHSDENENNTASSQCQRLLAVRMAPISDAGLNSIPAGTTLSGPPCPHLSPPSGSLIKGSSATIYVMQAV